MKLEIQRIDDIATLEELAGQWSDLLKDSTDNEPMTSPTWLLTWLRTYSEVEGLALRSLAFYDDESLVGLAPLVLRVDHSLGLPVRRLEFIGTGEAEVHETCSEYVGVLAAKGFEQSVAQCFAQALEEETLGAFDELLLTAMSSESDMPALLAQTLGKRVEYKILGGAPHVKLSGSWDKYLEGLSSSRRYLIRRSLKAWTKWSGETPTLKSLEPGGDFEEAYGILTRLHNERWSEEGKEGAFAAPKFSEFHRKAMQELFANDALWLCWLEAKGEPVVAIYNIVWDGKVRFYQSGRKIGLPQKVRAGLVIHACAIQEAIAKGYSEYDFLAGTTRYKVQLCTNIRPLVELRLQRAGVKGRALGGLRKGKQAAGRLRSFARGLRQ